jgi:hypothetical protein
VTSENENNVNLPPSKVLKAAEGFMATHVFIAVVPVNTFFINGRTQRRLAAADGGGQAANVEGETGCNQPSTEGIATIRRPGPDKD